MLPELARVPTGSSSRLMLVYPERKEKKSGLMPGIYSKRTRTVTRFLWRPTSSNYDQRGREKLAEYRMVETINSGVDYQANLVYKKDFDLGDYCTYINTEVNIATDKRITEVMETYEGAATELAVTFGTDEVSTVQQLIKREV